MIVYLERNVWFARIILGKQSNGNFDKFASYIYSSRGDLCSAFIDSV